MNDQLMHEENSKRGAIIIGSGPSLANVDMNLFKGYPSISFNRAYVAYSRWGFAPPYYACIDKTSLVDNIGEISQLAKSGAVKRLFLRDSAQNLGVVINDRVQLIHVTERPEFSTDLNRLGMFHNVAAVSIQIMAYLGFRRLLLVGVDGTYLPQADVKTVHCSVHLEAKTDNDINHFCKDYHGAGRRYTKPNPKKFLRGWRMLATELSGTGIEVINATPNSAVDCFPKLDLNKGLRWIDGEEAQ